MSRSLAALAAVTLLACSGGGGGGGGPPQPPDLVPPMVQSTSPLDHGALDGPSAPLTIQFSEAVDPATVNATTVRVTRGGAAFAGTLATVGPTVTFTPPQGWGYDQQYQVSVTAGVRDLAGNPLQNPGNWSFYSRPISAYRPPPLGNLSPAENAVDVSADAKVTFDLGSAIDLATLTPANVRVTRDGQPVTGVLSFSNGYATFTPTASLQQGATYTVTLGTGLRTESGTALSREYSWSFTVRAIRGSPVQLSDSRYQVQPPAFAADTAGDVVAAWLQHNGTYYCPYNPNCPNFDLYATRRTAGGAWLPPARLNDPGLPVWEAQLACAASGACLVVWREYDAWGTWASRVFSKLYTPGSGWGAQARVDADDADESGLTLASRPDLTSRLWWTAAGVVQERIYTPGTGWSVGTPPPPRNGAPLTRMNASGEVVRAWADGGHVFADVLASGSAWSDPVELDPPASTSPASVSALDVAGDGSAIVLWTQESLLRFSRFVPGAGWAGGNAIAAFPQGSWLSVAGLGLDDAGRALVLFTSQEGHWSAVYDPTSGWTAAAAWSSQIAWGGSAFSMAPPGAAAFAFSGVDPSGAGSQYTYAWLRAYAPGTGWGSPVAVGELGHVSGSVWVQTLRLATGETLVSWTDLSQIFVNVVP